MSVLEILKLKTRVELTAVELIDNVASMFVFQLVSYPRGHTDGIPCDKTLVNPFLCITDSCILIYSKHLYYSKHL